MIASMRRITPVLSAHRLLTGLGLSGSELDDLRDRGVIGLGDAA